MSIKTSLRKFISDQFGYYLHEVKTMPVGTDYAKDLTLKVGLNPKVIFDVGANIGQTVDFYHGIYPNAKIYSFEPIPSTFKKLEEKCRSVSNAQCFNIAFGEEDTSQEIQIVNDVNSVLNSINADFQSGLRSSAEKHETATIKIERLDDFTEKHGITQIDLLKIDTEGYEIPVLKGAARLLQQGNISAIVCEAGFMRSNTRNTYFGDINDLLEKHGYALFGMYEMGHLGFKVGRHYGNLLYISRKYRETEYRNWQFGH